MTDASLEPPLLAFTCTRRLAAEALGTALLLAVVNALVRPVLVLLTLPLTVLTLGLFLLVINAAMIGLVAFFLHGFHVHDFIAALLCWVVVSLTSWVVGWFTRA